MHKLIKASLPNDWEKEFATKEEAAAELRKHICKSCLLGEQEYVDSSSATGLSVEKVAPPDPNSMEDLLGTPCGREFWYEPPVTPSLSRPNQGS